MGLKEISDKVKFRKRVKKFMEELEEDETPPAPPAQDLEEWIRGIVVDEFNTYVMGGMKEALKIGGSFAGGSLLLFIIQQILGQVTEGSSDSKGSSSGKLIKPKSIPKEVEKAILRELGEKQ